VQRRAEEIGLPQNLGEILFAKGYIDADAMQELEAATAVATGEAKLVAGYEIIEKLGQGGMGAVYKARKTDDESLVALKILPPSMADDEAIKRFKREADMASKLAHNNIVKCLECGHDARKGFHFCALEYVDGEDLAKVIRRRWHVPEPEAIGITRKLAVALEYAHVSGLVHRDVKPENVMIASDGSVKLLDLGLARTVEAEATRLTQSGVFMGSPYYAAPEQAHGDSDVDTRADIYSLGATLYHMLTGQTPFSGRTAVEILQKHVAAQVPWPADVNPEISDATCSVVAKMMAKLPADRYQDANELIQDLDAIAAGEDPDIAESELRRSAVRTSLRVRKRPKKKKGKRKKRPATDRRASRKPLPDVPFLPEAHPDRGRVRPPSSKKRRPASNSRQRAADRGIARDASSGKRREASRDSGRAAASRPVAPHVKAAAGAAAAALLVVIVLIATRSPSTTEGGLDYRPPAAPKTVDVALTGAPATRTKAAPTRPTVAETEALPPAAPAPVGAGWIDLFDGKDLDGWRRSNPSAWVEDGVLCGSNSVDLLYAADWLSFELRFELLPARVPSDGATFGLSVNHPMMGRGSGRTIIVFYADGDAHLNISGVRAARAGAGTFPVEVWHRVGVVVADGAIVVTRDGDEVMKADVSSLPPQAGGVYIYSTSGATFRVRNIRARVRGR